MKKTIKIVIVVGLCLVGLVKLTEWALEFRFESMINSNPKRNYNLDYEAFDLHSFFTGITLSNLSITPVQKTKGAVIRGTVAYAELTGFTWTKYLFSKSLEVEKMKFISPEFNITVVEDTTSTQKKNKENSVQTLFSDILSRADLNQFQIKDGAIVIHESNGNLKGKIERINILASDIETDSSQLTYIIPFKLSNLEIEITNMFYQLNAYTKAKLGKIGYSVLNESVNLKNVSLEYDKDWVWVSRERGVQDDVMEFNLSSMAISGVNFTNSFWTNLDIDAQSMAIDKLSLSIMRNKNLKRPKDVEKTLFKGLIDKIPTNIDLDSIYIYNSKINYGELSVDKKKTGVITINDINGTITKLTTFPKRKEEFGGFKTNLSARLNNAAELSFDLSVPYNEDSFQLRSTLQHLDIKALNPSLKPLLGIEVLSGNLKRLEYTMKASYHSSKNTLIMDYDSLQLSVYKELKDGSLRRKGLISSIANAVVRDQNLPSDKKYRTASYTSKRNIYRSPFQYIVSGVFDGVKEIVPAKSVKLLFNPKAKQKKKRKKPKG